MAPGRGECEAFDIVAIASSAGGIQALMVVLGSFPAGFPAARPRARPWVGGT
ncbi:MAG: hypothetical protein ACRDRK_00690 [Pseudonocardia sp.]